MFGQAGIAVAMASCLMMRWTKLLQRRNLVCHVCEGGRNSINISLIGGAVPSNPCHGFAWKPNIFFPKHKTEAQQNKATPTQKRRWRWSMHEILLCIDKIPCSKQLYVLCRCRLTFRLQLSCCCWYWRTTSTVFSSSSSHLHLYSSIVWGLSN